MSDSEARDSLVTFGPCCFCGEHIPATDVDPCRVTVETTASAMQVWFCHARCFGDRVVAGRNMEPEIF
jgi:hypothetical protein